ncbi:MAG: hypothetical protein IPJ28_08700 [Betaproteobacteria bacterium]|nr:hypothetical protein [Betaproteobacteria bacterium]
MKSLPLALALFATLVAGCSKKGPTDADVLSGSRKILLSSCRQSGAKLPGITPAQLDTFCGCTTEKVIGIMGVDGLRGLATRGAPTEDVNQKLRQAGEECVEQIR